MYRINNYLKVVRNGHPAHSARYFPFDDFDQSSRAAAWRAVEALVGTERSSYSISVWRIAGKLNPIPTTVVQIGDSHKRAASHRPPTNGKGTSHHDGKEERGDAQGAASAAQ